MGFGRLERNKGNAPMSEINMTPLIDVMLVLLVIFIITAPLMTSAIKLDLPKTSAAQPSAVARFVTLVVNREGQAFVDDQPMTSSELATRLSQMAVQNPDTEIQLRADSSVPYGRVVELMGVAQKAGLSRIGFVADTPPVAKP
jgi:biopolymer transport protein TolR